MNQDASPLLLQVSRQNRARVGALHCHSHSMVEFSFSSDAPVNPMNLIRLNALFERIADRKTMGISAQKLFSMIRKTDGMPLHTIDRYQMILAIKDKRLVSRGPFLSMFKYENITFVNSLENAASSLCNRRNKRIKHRRSSSQGGLKNVEKIMSGNGPKYCVASMPIKTVDKDDSADKTGMIIVTDACTDDSDFSALSISPMVQLKKKTLDEVVINREQFPKERKQFPTEKLTSKGNKTKTDSRSHKKQRKLNTWTPHTTNNSDGEVSDSSLLKDKIKVTRRKRSKRLKKFGKHRGEVLPSMDDGHTGVCDINNNCSGSSNFTYSEDVVSISKPATHTRRKRSKFFGKHRGEVLPLMDNGYKGARENNNNYSGSSNFTHISENVVSISKPTTPFSIYNSDGEVADSSLLRDKIKVTPRKRSKKIGKRRGEVLPLIDDKHTGVCDNNDNCSGLSNLAQLYSAVSISKPRQNHYEKEILYCPMKTMLQYEQTNCVQNSEGNSEDDECTIFKGLSQFFSNLFHLNTRKDFISIHVPDDNSYSYEVVVPSSEAVTYSITADMNEYIPISNSRNSIDGRSKFHAQRYSTLDAGLEGEVSKFSRSTSKIAGQVGYISTSNSRNSTEKRSKLHTRRRSNSDKVGSNSRHSIDSRSKLYTRQYSDLDARLEREVSDFLRSTSKIAYQVGYNRDFRYDFESHDYDLNRDSYNIPRSTSRHGCPYSESKTTKYDCGNNRDDFHVCSKPSNYCCSPNLLSRCNSSFFNSGSPIDSQNFRKKGGQYHHYR